MGIKIYNSKLGNGLSSIQRKHRGILTATSVYLHFTCTFYMRARAHPHADGAWRLCNYR